MCTGLPVSVSLVSTECTDSISDSSDVSSVGILEGLFCFFMLLPMKYGKRDSKIFNLFKSRLLMMRTFASFTTRNCIATHVSESGCLVYNHDFPTHLTLASLAVLINTGTDWSICKFMCLAYDRGNTECEAPVSHREWTFIDVLLVPGLSLIKAKGMNGLSDFVVLTLSEVT